MLFLVLKTSLLGPSSHSTAYPSSKLYPCIPPLGSQKTLHLLTSRRKRRQCLPVATSVFRNRSSISNNGASDSATLLLERLFVQYHKLEERMTGNGQVSYDIDFDVNLGTLESHLQAALEALKRKEEDLYEAERTVILEHAELSRVKEEVEVRAEQIAAICYNQELMENDLRQTSLKQISQAKEMEDLKLRLKEREHEVLSMQSALYSKEEQLCGVRSELMQKTEEVEKVSIDLRVKAQLLNDTEEVVRRQETELLELQDSLKDKESDLVIAVTQRKLEEEKATAMEVMLSKQMMAWLLAKEELRKLGEGASTRMEERNSTMEDFRRVKKLLVAMRSELVCSQKSLASSRQRMEGQEVLLEGQFAELKEQKKLVISHMMSLKEAHTVVEDEQLKLKVAEARNKELEQSLMMERALVHNLQKELQKEKSFACEAIKEVSFLRTELDKKRTEFEETSRRLHLKELELGEAKVEIQHLKSELSSLEHALEERDSELYIAKKRLEEVNAEIAELRMLMKSKEEQLIQATSLMKEKDDYTRAMQGELNATKLKFTEAEHVVERIANLTNKFVASAQEEHNTSLGLNAKEQPTEKPTDYHQWQMKDLETELESSMSRLRMKEMEVLAIQRSLNIKDEELKSVVDKLDERETGLKQAKEEKPNDAAGSKIMCSFSQERINENIAGDAAIQKFSPEAAEHGLEAATTALHKLEEMSRELLRNLTMADPDAEILTMNGSDPLRCQTGNSVENVFSSEVARLSKLTEQLVVEAGIR